jgi:uncharacterized membrane protein YqaE (UPF0057 family)
MVQLIFILKVRGSPIRRGVYKKRFSLNVIKFILNCIKFLLTLLGYIKFLLTPLS